MRSHLQITGGAGRWRGILTSIKIGSLKWRLCRCSRIALTQTVPLRGNIASAELVALEWKAA
ncbi:MAG: hypothetical protein ABIX01_02965 [Chitinophagaceae bacterium]